MANSWQPNKWLERGMLSVTSLAWEQATRHPAPPLSHTVMSLMKLFRSCVILAVIACAISCSQDERQREIVKGWRSVPHVPNPNTEQEALELELREIIFRNEIAGRCREDVAFISFGYAEDRNWIEPPDGFADRLSDLPVVVRPVSDANLFFGGLTSKTDGLVGRIYLVQIVEWLDEDSVRVLHGWYFGPLSAVLVDGAVYQYTDGEWKIEAEGARFVS